jgi:hypothetical protein
MGRLTSAVLATVTAFVILELMPRLTRWNRSEEHPRD